MKNIIGISLVSSLFIYLFAGITSCSGTGKTSETAGQIKSADHTSQIIFLNYSIQRDNTEGYKIELISKIVADGKVKINANQHPNAKEGDLKCLTLDENKRPISNIIIHNPLIKRIEYQQENGSLATKEIFLDSTDFSIRMQLDHASRFIAIERINSSHSSYLIITEIN